MHWTRTRRANGPPMPKNDFVKPFPRNAPNHARVPAPRTARPLPTFLYSGSTTRYAARSRREPESHPKKAISAGYRDPGSRRRRANPLWEMSYLTRRARAYAKIPVKLAFEHVECDSNPEPEADSLPYLKSCSMGFDRTSVRPVHQRVLSRLCAHAWTRPCTPPWVAPLGA